MHSEEEDERRAMRVILKVRLVLDLKHVSKTQETLEMELGEKELSHMIYPSETNERDFFSLT